MKNKFTLITATLLILGLAIFAFAYGTGSGPTMAQATCKYCKRDSCPMKNMAASVTAEAKASLDDCDCCKEGSCPMHKGDGTEMNHAAMSVDGKDCDCTHCKHKPEKKDTKSA